MRILILGGDGMLGHQLFLRLGKKYDVKTTLRQDTIAYEKFGIFKRDNAYAGIDVRSMDRLLEVLADFNPDTYSQFRGNNQAKVDRKRKPPEYRDQLSISSPFGNSLRIYNSQIDTFKHGLCFFRSER